MTTRARKDFDAELAAWLDLVHAEQAVDDEDVARLDQLADLWLANGDAKAIKDPRCPGYAAAHERIDAVLRGMGL